MAGDKIGKIQVYKGENKKKKESHSQRNKKLQLEGTSGHSAVGTVNTELP